MGGYRMVSVTDPMLCRRVALRYTAALFPICIGSTLMGLTDTAFLVDSSLINAYFTYKAIQFYREGTDTSARKLFFASLWHLPATMLLLLLHKATDGPLALLFS